ncbi:MAG: arylamine N-acetyltransferase [Polyangiaceae bacterium]|nr:arylamine N-acetyltransferase [Polyangiaceae bacterium]
MTLDLDAYWSRIGWRPDAGGTGPSEAQLHALALAHVQRVPFENLDVLLGRGVSIDPDAVFDKLVRRRRGGYCFEQNTLLHRVLSSLGYDAELLSARVRLGRGRDVTPARTHVLNRVRLGGVSYLLDVGVGGLSPTFALRLAPGEQRRTHEPRRLVWEGDWAGEARGPEARIFHQVALDGAWQDVCELTLERSHPVDREVGNWYTSRHPKSHFLDKLTVARATPGGRVTLLNRRLTVRDGDAVRVEELPTPQALVGALRDRFGIELPEHEARSLPALDWQPDQ